MWTLWSTNRVVIILSAILFVSLFLFFYLLWRRLRQVEHVNRRQRIRENLMNAYVRRVQQKEEQWQSYGEEETKSILYRLDRLLDYSNIRQAVPFASAELLLCVFAGLILGGLVLALLFHVGWYTGLFAGGVACLTLYVAIRFLADRRYDMIENGLFAFVNVVSTESKSSDDLITILDASLKSLCRPLQVVVGRCCLEARNTGRVADSLRHLELSVENEEFRKIVRNLAMCYRTDADYSKVIVECRMGLKEHISAREEQKVLLGNTRLEVVELVGLGVLTLVLIGNIIGESNVVWYLYQTLAGRVVLFYILAVMLWCLADAFLTRRPR